MDINGRLKDLGIILPAPAKAVANYLPYRVVGNLVYISGQIAFDEGELITGKIGDNLNVMEGVAAARICLINVMAQLDSACDGDLSRVKNCIKLGIFVNATPDCTAHPQIANGASDLIVEIMGANGRHSRAAVGCSSLPLGSAVEVEAMFEIA